MGCKVAVLMGGQSFEREFSLESGKLVCHVLEEMGHEVLPLDTVSDLVDTLKAEKVDVAYIALHGKHGEDGTIQSLLEFLNIPYVGCTAPVCRVTRNKSNVPHVISSHRLDGEGAASWPAQMCLSVDAFKSMGAACALRSYEEHIPGYPMVVKPACGGSAMGLHKVHSFDELASAILDALSFDDEVIVGEWVDGVELGVSMIEDAEGNVRVLPPVEICSTHEFFDTNDRMDSDGVEFFAPPKSEQLADPAAIEKINAAAIETFKAFGCRDLARVDMIWDGNAPKILEIDVSPGMTKRSFFPIACKAAGLTLGEVLSNLLYKAVKRS